MTIQNIIRAWTDPSYRASLNENERLLLPENPAGMIELAGTALDVVAGGGGCGCGGNGTKKSKKSTKSHKSKKSNGGCH